VTGTQLLAVGALCVAARSAHATPPPAIEPGTRTVVAFAGGAAKVSVVWPAIENVSRYRARWTDAGAVVDIELSGTAFEREESTPGRHELSVVAIDAAGRESAPAKVAIDVVAVSALAPGADAPVYPVRNAFAIGTRFTSPGMTCQLDAQELGARIVRCAAESGPRVEVPVVIVPVIVDGPHRPLVRGHAMRIHITVASVAHVGERLVLESTGAVDLGETERTETGLTVTVTPSASATVAGLVVRASGVELGRVELELTDAPPPPRPVATSSQWFALDLGIHAGSLVLPGLGGDAIALGGPTTAEHALTTAPLLGGHVGWFPSRYAGLEVAAALATPTYAGQAGRAAVIVSRAQLAARVVDDGPYGLRLLGGVDLLALLHERRTSSRDVAGGVHYGAAFTIHARSAASVRIEALHVMTPAMDAGYAHAVQLTLGLVTRLGRQDR
jgi:hypothetical protein